MIANVVGVLLVGGAISWGPIKAAMLNTFKLFVLIVGAPSVCILSFYSLIGNYTEGENDNST